MSQRLYSRRSFVVSLPTEESLPRLVMDLQHPFDEHLSDVVAGADAHPVEQAQK